MSRDYPEAVRFRANRQPARAWPKRPDLLTADEWRADTCARYATGDLAPARRGHWTSRPASYYDWSRNRLAESRSPDPGLPRPWWWPETRTELVGSLGLILASVLASLLLFLR